MATIDQLLGAFQQFGNAAKEYGAAEGIRNATEEVQQLNQNAEMDFQQRIAAQQQIAQGLQGRLAGLGVNAQAIAQAVGSVAPPKIGTSADARAAAQTIVDPSERMQMMKLASQLAEQEGTDSLAQKKPEMDAKFQNDKDLLAMRLGAQRADTNSVLSADQAMKKQERDAQLQVPGFQLAGETRPRAEEADKLRTGVATARQMFKDLTRLKELVKIKGSFEVGGPDAGEMDTLATGIRLSAKEAENLGVLNGKDYEIITKLVPETGNLSALFTFNKTAIRKLEQAIDRTVSGVDQRLKARGYKPAASEKISQAEAWLAKNEKHPKAADVRQKLAKMKLGE